jgi:hypothetical protein
MTACASTGEGTGSSATAGVSAGGGLSRGIERSMTASNASATPPGSAIHPRLRKAETLGPGICWTREAGWRGGSDGGALPCHSHKPDPWFSSLGDVVSDNTIACPPQEPKCGGDRQTDEMRSVSRTGRNLRLWRQFYPKPTHSNVAGQAALIDLRLDPRGAYGWPRLGVLLQARAWEVASETPEPGAPPSPVPRPRCATDCLAAAVADRVAGGRSKSPAKSMAWRCCGSTGKTGAAPAHALWRPT